MAGYASYFHQGGELVVQEKYFKYDYNGNLVEEKTRLDDGNGINWVVNRYFYDEYGNLVKSVDPQGREVFYEYDPRYNGFFLTAIKRIVDGAVVATEYGYNVFNGWIVNYTEHLPPTAYVSEPVEDPQWSAEGLNVARFNQTFFLLELPPSSSGYAKTRFLIGNATLVIKVEPREESCVNLTILKGIGDQWFKVNSTLVGDQSVIRLNFELLFESIKISVHETSCGQTATKTKTSSRELGVKNSYSTQSSEKTTLLVGITSLSRKTLTAQRTTQYKYDALGRLIEIVKPDGTRLKATYFDEQLKARFYDETGSYKEVIYDPLGRVIEERLYDPYGNPLSEPGKLGYDDLGRLAWKYSMGVNISYTYDFLDRVVEKKRSDGAKTTYTYIDNPTNWYEHTQYGKLPYVKITDPDGSTKTVVYGPFGTAAVYYGDDYATWNYFYNEAGKLSKIVDPYGREVKFYYNNLGRLIRVEYPDGGVEEYRYDLVGNVLEHKQVDGRIFHYIYDDSYRLIEIKVEVNGTETTISRMTYDPSGRLILVDSSGIEKTYSYDILDRIIQKTWKINGTEYSFNYQYDERGLLTSLEYPNGLTVTFTYDYAGHLLTANIPQLGSFQLGYNQTTGILEWIEYPNGVKVEYTYDQLNRPTGILAYIVRENLGDSKQGRDSSRATLPGGTSVSSWREYIFSMNIVYSKTSEILAANISQYPYGSWSEHYVYDQYHRLIKATSRFGEARYGYDQANRIQWAWINGVNTTYTYQGWDQPVEIGGLQLIYDQAGRIIHVNGENKNTAYVYDKAGRLVKIISSTEEQASFLYDGEGNRVLVKTTKGNKITLGLYEEYSNGTKIANIAVNGLILLRIIQNNESQRTEYLVYDLKGNARLVLDGDGQVKASITYTPYGSRLEGNYTRLGFDSREETCGLLYYGVRYYSPSLRIFTEPDTISTLSLDSPLIWSRYGYAAWNPIKFGDDGHLPALVVAAVMVALTALDIYLTAQDVWEAVNNPTQENLAIAAFDIATWFIPGDEIAIDLPRIFIKITFGEDILKFIYRHGDEALETALKFSDEAAETLGKIFKRLKTAIREGKIASRFWKGKLAEILTWAQYSKEGYTLIDITYSGKKLAYSADLILKHEITGETLYIQVKNWMEGRLSRILYKEEDHILDFIEDVATGKVSGKYVLIVYTDKPIRLTTEDLIEMLISKHEKELFEELGLTEDVIKQYLEVVVWPHLPVGG